MGKRLFPFTFGLLTFLAAATPSLGSSTAASSCDFAGKLEKSLHHANAQLPPELEGTVREHDIQSSVSGSDRLRYSTDRTSSRRGLNFYNIESENPDFAARQIAHQTGAVLSPLRMRPILRLMLKQTHEMHGNLSFDPMRAEGGGFDIKMDFLSPELAANGSYERIRTVPKLPENPDAQRINVPRIDVRVAQDQVVVFTGTTLGRAYGHALVTEGPTSHGVGIIVTASHQAHDPVMLEVTGISKFYFGPTARPIMVHQLNLARKIAQDLYPGRDIVFKLMDKKLRYNPITHEWVP